MAIDPRTSEAPDARFAARAGGTADDGNADVASIERAAVQRLHARMSTIDRSLVGVATADRATVRQSAAGIVAARSLAADQVRAAVVIAPVVRGEVHALVDMRAAFALGFGMALGRAALLLLGRAFRR